jgi:hypothetical protein
MPIFRIWQYGQSNMVFLNNTTPGSPVADTLIPILQALVDPTEAQATIERQYDLTGTCFSGIGSALSNVAMTLRADGFYDDSPNFYHLVRPAAPSDAVRFADWSSWPLSNTGNARITYAGNLPAATKAEVSCILMMHSEYDTRGYAVNGWAQNDPRVVEFAQRRMISALRTALGKTAANCPALASVPVPYTAGSDAGFDAVHRAYLAIANDPAFNLHIIATQAMDCTWDRDEAGTGNYTWHANNDDLALLARRFAPGIARVMGPIWAPGSFRTRPHLGPVPFWAQRIDALTIDVWVRHDGGAALVLPADPVRGWGVTYNGRVIALAGAAVQPDNRRIRLALATPLASAAMTRVAYAGGNTRLRPDGVVRDDAASFDAKALSPLVTGANRLDGALARTAFPLVVRTTAPTI